MKDPSLWVDTSVNKVWKGAPFENTLVWSYWDVGIPQQHFTQRFVARTLMAQYMSGQSCRLTLLQSDRGVFGCERFLSTVMLRAEEPPAHIHPFSFRHGTISTVLQNSLKSEVFPAFRGSLVAGSPCRWLLSLPITAQVSVCWFMIPAATLKCLSFRVNFVVL